MGAINLSSPSTQGAMKGYLQWWWRQTQWGRLLCAMPRAYQWWRKTISGTMGHTRTQKSSQWEHAWVWLVLLQPRWAFSRRKCCCWACVFVSASSFKKDPPSFNLFTSPWYTLIGEWLKSTGIMSCLYWGSNWVWPPNSSDTSPTECIDLDNGESMSWPCRDGTAFCSYRKQTGIVDSLCAGTLQRTFQQALLSSSKLVGSTCTPLDLFKAVLQVYINNNSLSLRTTANWVETGQRQQHRETE